MENQTSYEGGWGVYGFLWASGWRLARRTRSTDIRGKLGAVPGGQHHLDPQEHVLQKSALKKVAHRVESDSLNQFLDVHGHQGEARSRSWGTAQSRPPE